MKGKMMRSLSDFSHLSSVRGYDLIGITSNEAEGVSASLAFEMPSAPAAGAVRADAVKELQAELSARRGADYLNN